MGQNEIWKYIKNNAHRCDITIHELSEEFNLTQSSVNRIISRLKKFNEVLITVDGRKNLIRINPEVLENGIKK